MIKLLIGIVFIIAILVLLGWAMLPIIKYFTDGRAAEVRMLKNRIDSLESDIEVLESKEAIARNALYKVYMGYAHNPAATANDALRVIGDM